MNTYRVFERRNIMAGGTPQTRIKELRKSSNITQQQLANYLGVDQSLIPKLENGSRKLNISIIEKLCSLFRCSEEYLMGENSNYVPLNFAFRASEIQAGDLESIAAVNKIIMNLRYMNEILQEDVE